MTSWALQDALENADNDGVCRHTPSAFDAAPVATALTLVGASDREASIRAAALLALTTALQTAPPLIIRALDQAFRSSRRMSRFRVEMNRRTHRDLVDERMHPCPGGPILASMSRDGYLRADAVDALGRRRGPGFINALLVRTSDPVAPVREAALDFIHGALKRANAPGTRHDDERNQFAHALPLVEQMQTWTRTRSGALPSNIGKMLTSTEAGQVALAIATRSDDAATRQAALRVSLDAGAPGQSQQIAMIGAALMDDSPRIRLAATRRALSDPDLAKIFYERLHVDKSPHIRALTVRARAKLALEHADDDGAHEALQRATFDHNANVRFWARRLVLKFGSPLDYRGRALAILDANAGAIRTSHAMTSTVKEVVGALATLSEFGRSQDFDVVSQFCRHPRARIRREAVRTLEILRGL